MLDLRYPMGMMFALVGAMLAIYGAFTSGDKIYEHSLGLNINLYWGLALLGFGILVLGLARWAAAVGKRQKDSGNSDAKARDRLGSP